LRYAHALAKPASAISNALMKPAFANIVADSVDAARIASVRPIANASAAASCKPAPVNCGRRRCWRRPSQASAAPSSANTQAVACADKASGTASVAKPTASRAYDCASTSKSLRRRSHHASAAYSAPNPSAQNASGIRLPSIKPACSENATSGMPNTRQPSIRSRRPAGRRRANSSGMTR